MNIKQTAIKPPMGMGVIGFDGSGSVGDATTSRGDGERNDDNVLFRVKSLD